MASSKKRNYSKEEFGDATSSKQQHLELTTTDSMGKDWTRTYLQQVLPVFNRMFEPFSSAKTTMDLTAPLQDGLKVSYTIPCCQEDLTSSSTYEEKEYIISTEDNGVITCSAILGKLYEKTLQRHKNHFSNLRKWDDLEEQIEQVFNDLYYDGSQWQFKETLSRDEAIEILHESSLIDCKWKDPYGYTLLEDENLSTLLKEALHPSVSMGYSAGRKTIRELLSTIADINNLKHCTNVRNIDGGDLSNFSVPFNTCYLNPDITWTLTGIKSHVVLYQILIIKGVNLDSTNRRQLKTLLIGSLLGQWQVFGLLINATEAEIYFAHRENSKVHLLLVNRYDLTEQEQFKRLAMDILKTVTYQACSMVVDPYHLKQKKC